MHRYLSPSVLTLCLFGLVACGTQNKVTNSVVDAAPEPVKISENTMPQIAEFIATVTYINLEGGFFALYSQDGRHFMPQQLGKAHRRDGLVVKVKGQILENVVTVQQHGKVLKIMEISIIDDSKVSKRSEM